MSPSREAAEAVGVLGAGSWGSALSVHLARIGHRVRLWARTSEQVEKLRAGSNPDYLPGVELPSDIQPTTDLADLADCDPILAVIPSHCFREVVAAFLEANAGDSPLTVISGTKGIEADTLTRMSGVCFEEGLKANRELRFAVLSGPTFAEELVAGTPTAAVLASEDLELAHRLRDVLSGGNFRLYSSPDVVGVEIAGTAKNVVAIAAGVTAGLGFGHNTLAALMTRGLHEVTRLGMACGGRRRTFSGLAGMGDLVLTCTGGPSRNRQTGVKLAEGKSLEQISTEIHMVAEGVRNSVTLSRIAGERGVEMPITEQMVQVLYEGRSPRSAVEELMRRDLKSEER